MDYYRMNNIIADTDMRKMIATSGDIPNDIMLKLRGIEGIIDVKLINCEG